MSNSSTIPEHSWLHRPLVGFDTETTGVNTERDRIVTAAVVSGQPNDRFVQNWLLDPGVEIPKGASQIHGITTEQARDQGEPAATAVADIARALITKLSSGGILVAFNVGYDLEILLAELHRYEHDDLADKLLHAADLIIDPLVLDRGLVLKRRGKRTLTDLCQHYNVEVTAELHSADIDVLATLDLLAAMVNMHPQLRDFEAHELMLWQQQAHRKWATDFNNWRATRGLSGPGAKVHWPMEHRESPETDGPGLW